MTNEEMQKTMEFILEHQAQFVVSNQRLQEERVRDQPRLAQLEESFQLLVQLAQTSDSRFDSLEANLVQLAQASDSRLNTLEANQLRDQPRRAQLEESFQLLVQLAQASDSRFDILETSQLRDQPRLTQLEESFQLLVQLAQTANSRLDLLEGN